MTTRYAWLALASVPFAALLTAACSSDETSPPLDTNVDGGSDAVDGEATPPDAATDAGREAGPLVPPPPYDFTVKCTSDPCVTRLAARGGGHACVLLQGGSVRCWGSNDSGQLGTGNGDGGSLAKYESVPRQVLGIANATGITAAGSGITGTTCVVYGAGDVACFGDDAWGQLGRGDEPSNRTNPDPVAIAGLRAKSVTLTGTFALAVGTDDRLWSWGANDATQLARATPGPDAGTTNAPAHADRVAGAVLSTGGTSKNGFVVTESGDVLSWGGTADQLGRASSVTPDPTPKALAVSEASSVSASATHACALSRGEILCWGQNDYGQLGTTRRADESFPARVVLPDRAYAVAVAAGGNNTCAIMADGKLLCWGANGSGQIGAAADRDRPTPTIVDGLAEEPVAVAVMDASICALLRSGTVRCWGDNLLGQLGRGTRDSKSHPESAPVVFK